MDLPFILLTNVGTSAINAAVDIRKLCVSEERGREDEGIGNTRTSLYLFNVLVLCTRPNLQATTTQVLVSTFY